MRCTRVADLDEMPVAKLLFLSELTAHDVDACRDGPLQATVLISPRGKIGGERAGRRATGDDRHLDAVGSWWRQRR